MNFRNYPRPKRRRRPSRLIDGVTHLQCSRCGRWKPEDGFHVRRRATCGRRSECVECKAKDRRSYGRRERVVKTWLPANAEATRIAYLTRLGCDPHRLPPMDNCKMERPGPASWHVVDRENAKRIRKAKGAGR